MVQLQLSIYLYEEFVGNKIPMTFDDMGEFIKVSQSL